MAATPSGQRNQRLVGSAVRSGKPQGYEWAVTNYVVLPDGSVVEWNSQAHQNAIAIEEAKTDGRRWTFPQVPAMRVVGSDGGALSVSIGGSTGVTPAPNVWDSSSAVDEAAPFTYVGYAAPGTADGDAAWAIKRIEDLGGGDFRMTWADGNTNFDQTWTGRAGYSYS